MWYMNAPLKLTERQLLIYFYLYKKCDFDSMEVKVTTSQIVTGVKIIELTDRIVNTELKKMIEAGFLKLVKKGSKGNFSIYQIIKTNEMMVTNAYVIGNSKDSNSNELSGDKVTNAYLIGNSNTKNKEKDNNKKEKESNLDKIISSYTNNNDLAEAIKDFIKMRKAIKKPLTDRAMKGILNRLGKFSNSDIDKVEMLEKSIENCWVSVYELKNKKGPTATGPKENTSANSVCNNKNFNTRFKGEFL